MGRYKIVKGEPMNREQRRAAERGKDWVDVGAGKETPHTSHVDRLRKYPENEVRDGQDT
jgi:hypothetical protein